MIYRINIRISARLNSLAQQKLIYFIPLLFKCIDPQFFTPLASHFFLLFVRQTTAIDRFEVQHDQVIKPFFKIWLQAVGCAKPLNRLKADVLNTGGQ